MMLSNHMRWRWMSSVHGDSMTWTIKQQQKQLLKNNHQKKHHWPMCTKTSCFTLKVLGTTLSKHCILLLLLYYYYYYCKLNIVYRFFSALLLLLYIYIYIYIYKTKQVYHRTILALFLQLSLTLLTSELRLWATTSHKHWIRYSEYEPPLTTNIEYCTQSISLC